MSTYDAANLAPGQAQAAVVARASVPCVPAVSRPWSKLNHFDITTMGHKPRPRSSVSSP